MSTGMIGNYGYMSWKNPDESSDSGEPPRLKGVHKNPLDYKGPMGCGVEFVREKSIICEECGFYMSPAIIFITPDDENCYLQY